MKEDEKMDAHFFGILLEIILINIVLSGDNAVVIALASRKLSEDKRKKAIFIGTVGALGLRVVLTFAAVYLLEIPFVEIIGGLLLLYIAFDLIKSANEDPDLHSSASLFGAIRTIIFADLVMSLDNVLAIAGAAEGNIVLIVIGLAISVPLIIFGSQLIMNLMDKYPLLVWAGSGIIAYTAGKMMVDDKYGHLFVERTWPILEYIIPIAFVLLIVGLGTVVKKRQQKEGLTK
ncbi:TerC family protein [Paenisporosarcina sp. FSL H8-0542]|uniref:TerC family protein n=1 Tax=Paenisporosarcina sp. FSL H8-0542 TaxID=2921401 RepID=UPI00315AADF4